VCDSAVGTVTGVQAGRRSSGGSIPGRAREFFLLRRVQTGPGITRCPLLFYRRGGGAKNAWLPGLKFTSLFENI
jgi:hypothetical protein